MFSTAVLSCNVYSNSPLLLLSLSVHQSPRAISPHPHNNSHCVFFPFHTPFFHTSSPCVVSLYFRKRSSVTSSSCHSSMCGSITRSPLHSAARGRLVSLTHTPENVRSSVIILVSVYKCDKGKECVWSVQIYCLCLIILLCCTIFKNILVYASKPSEVLFASALE